MSAELVTGDTGSTLHVMCEDNETDEALSIAVGSVVVLRWRDNNNDLVERAMTITDGPNGEVEYLFDDEEIIGPRMRFEIEITGTDCAS